MWNITVLPEHFRALARVCKDVLEIPDGESIGDSVQPHRIHSWHYINSENGVHIVQLLLDTGFMCSSDMHVNMMVCVRYPDSVSRLVASDRAIKWDMGYDFSMRITRVEIRDIMTSLKILMETDLFRRGYYADLIRIYDADKLWRTRNLEDMRLAHYVLHRVSK